MFSLEAVAIEIVFAIGGTFFAFLWWLIKQYDKARQEDVARRDEARHAENKAIRGEVQIMQATLDVSVKHLWEKHDEDAKRLQDLELDIAKRHYVKDELDNRFERLEISLRDGLASLDLKMDKLIEAVTRGAIK